MILSMKKLFSHALVVILLLAGCGKTDPNPDNDYSEVTTSGCKQSFVFTTTGNDFSTIQYNYSNKVLHIKHINAGFNCCPDKISFKASVSDTIIGVDEKESKALCDCMCLFDLDYDIREVERKRYWITFNEPYTGLNDKKLAFYIDLCASDTGSFKVSRHNYPWGL
jgi:hypothetical protein